MPSIPTGSPPAIPPREVLFLKAFSENSYKSLSPNTIMKFMNSTADKDKYTLEIIYTLKNRINSLFSSLVGYEIIENDNGKYKIIVENIEVN